MMTVDELMQTERLSKQQAEDLMDQLGLNKMDIAEACGVTYSTLQTYWYYRRLPEKHQDTLIQLFLDTLADQSAPENKGSRYSQQDEDFIRRNWPQMTDQQIAAELGRTPESIAQKRYHMGRTGNGADAPDATDPESEEPVGDRDPEQPDEQPAGEQRREHGDFTILGDITSDDIPPAQTASRSKYEPVAEKARTLKPGSGFKVKAQRASATNTIKRLFEKRFSDPERFTITRRKWDSDTYMIYIIHNQE